MLLKRFFPHASKMEYLTRAYRAGFRIYLYFIATENPELNVARVKQRVHLGGHDAAAEKIISRYYRCLDPFYAALQFAYRAYFFDNTTSRMRLFAEYGSRRTLETVGMLPHRFEEYILKKI